MFKPLPKTSLAAFAVIAGIGILLMMASPFAELMVYGKLVVSANAPLTVSNIIAHHTLFTYGILCYLFNFMCDILVAWALYGLFKPVSESLSLLTAWVQLVYAVISLIAMINLITALRLVDTPDYIKIFGRTQLQTQVMLSLHAFRDGWSLGFFFFGINLVLRGYLAYRSGYVPKIVGILLIIAGVGYFINTLQPFLFPTLNIDYIMITYFGELVFMLWLLIRGYKIKEPNYVAAV